MIDTFHAFLDWLEALPVIWAYVTLFFVAYVENIVPPIPGDLVIVFGGYLAGIGMLSVPVVILAATIGGGVGFMNAYAIGRWIGTPERLINRLNWFSSRRFSSVRNWLNKWGFWLVLANRFLAGVRPVIAFSVGMSKLPAGMTALCATISAAIWATLIVIAGYLFGENWQVVGGILDTYGLILALLTFFLALYMLIPWLVKRYLRKDPAKDDKVSSFKSGGS